MHNLIAESTHSILNHSMAEMLRIILACLDKEVNLVTVVDSDNPHSVELAHFITEVSRINNFIHCEFYKRGKNPDVETLVHADKFPFFALLDHENYYNGVKYHGVPKNYQLIAFALTLYNVSGPGLPIDVFTADRIMNINDPINIKICVASSCPQCVDPVVLSHRLALLNPEVQSEMIDIDLFPELKEQYGLTHTPALIINDKSVYYDIKTIEDLVNILSV